MAERQSLSHRQTQPQPQPRAPPPSLLSTVGEEIVRIVAPVSVCIVLVVLLVTVLNSNPNNNITITLNSPPSLSRSFSSSWDWTNLKDAIFTSLIFIAIITIFSFVLVLLFYFRFTCFLKSYMIFSSFIVLFILGGQIALFLLATYLIPVDAVTFSVLLFNFSVVGAVSVFRGAGAPLVVTQSYLVIIAVLIAYWFTFLPEWTSWALLVSLAIYDIAAVLLPGGPLRLLVELAMSRDEDLPALVYEARPVSVDDVVHGRINRSLGREVGSHPGNISNSSDHYSNCSFTAATSLLSAEGSIHQEVSERRDIEGIRLIVDENDSSPGSPLPTSELTTPLLENGLVTRDFNVPDNSESPDDFSEGGIGLGSSGAIKLGLGDFIFYSVLVARVAMYDFMAVYACYLAIVAGLGITLLLLAFYRKALPALPISIGLGVLFYLLTRTLLEEFLVQCSVNLIMF